MPDARTGHCQCGAVRYRLTGEPLTLFACHCTDCQRQSSSAFGMALWVKKADVELLSGELKEWVRELPSGRRMACRFCPGCGTRLFHQVLGQEALMSIKPGTLEDTRWLRPAGHIWTASRQPWVRLDENSLQYPGNPDGYEALIAAWLHPTNPCSRA
ncbi:GFA family protein [uncultured Azohydromonas sp.]|jgi:Uncharacterized conserved protein|uniref:GFA family protein n=1 Tax=uncultured Azohydromonas sp. TaxID=487342 RepID=UPI0026352B00|nr:GFA family protein [uncultured Azohydromonas sp.]